MFSVDQATMATPSGTRFNTIKYAGEAQGLQCDFTKWKFLHLSITNQVIN